jgi:hypothetical protein
MTAPLTSDRSGIPVNAAPPQTMRTLASHVLHQGDPVWQETHCSFNLMRPLGANFEFRSKYLAWLAARATTHGCHQSGVGRGGCPRQSARNWNLSARATAV